MKVVLVITICLCIELSAAAEDVKLLIFKNVHGIGGEYKFEYETSDGSRREETGKVERDPDGTESAVVEGSYSYIGDNDVIYTVNYIADKHGYRLQQHRPQVPAARKQHKQDELQVRLNPVLVNSLVGGGIR